MLHLLMYDDLATSILYNFSVDNIYLSLCSPNAYICKQGYKQKKGFIIAQSPMENTVRDFVKMIYERECGVVVMLCGCEEGGVEMCAQYWPTYPGSVMKYGEYLVSTVSENASDGVNQRVLTITDPKVKFFILAS